ncbi:MAG: DUF362 domain-containing protein [Acidobacteriota bacterium]|jgi:uncharacterized protein (DUF362 family)|nr:DUF362 domain-containing protein [Acidobacteriota bacterium]
MRLTRRAFGRLSSLGGLALLGDAPEADAPDIPPAGGGAGAPPEGAGVRVAVIGGAERGTGFARALALLEGDGAGALDFSGGDVYLKASYGSPAPPPATTHPDALRAVVGLLRARGAEGITLVERSGMGRTREVMGRLGALEVLESLSVAFLPLDELDASRWRFAELPGSHWPGGIAFPDFLIQDCRVVQLCSPRTHRFGGGFSASLKNSIGLIAKRVGARDATGQDIQGRGVDAAPSHGRNFMQDLHASPAQGQMIAEANQVYSPGVVFLDATEVFVAGGPEKGEVARPGVIAASRDRVALDAVAFSVLQYAGARIGGADGVFEQPQIKRAAELRLGARAPEGVAVMSDDGPGRLLGRRLESILRK